MARTKDIKTPMAGLLRKKGPRSAKTLYRRNKYVVLDPDGSVVSKGRRVVYDPTLGAKHKFVVRRKPASVEKLAERMREVVELEHLYKQRQADRLVKTKF